ncbi:hypothetical protein BHM03_00036040 [Ensete ventricosum]|nr:hypothetical protein BHM03_00036040 [Ensete ventricosum]
MFYTTCRGLIVGLTKVAGRQTARYRAVPPKIDCRRPIEGEIDCRRSIEGEKGKKKKRTRRKKEKRRKEIIPSACAPSSLACRCRSCAVAACAPPPPAGRHHPHTVIACGSQVLFLPCGEKDRGDWDQTIGRMTRPRAVENLRWSHAEAVKEGERAMG